MNDTLSFLIKPLDDRGAEVLTLTPVINEIPLTVLLENFEREHDMDPAGGYGGLVPDFFRYGPLDRYFLGQAESEFFKNNGEYYLLACQCGEVGCWPLSARITVTDTNVIWDRFGQEHRRERDYSGFGPFTFKLHPYKKTIADIAARLAGE